MNPAFHKKLDQGALLGQDSPFVKNIIGAATSAGNIVTETVNKYDDFNLAMATLEEEDLEANGIATTRKQRVKYRGTKDKNGLPIFNTANSNGVDDILGLPIAYTPKATLGEKALEVVGDWNFAYYGILKGLEYEILTEATLTTIEASDGEPINLAERDMIALKATMTVGFMVVKDEAFAVITAGEGEPEGTGDSLRATGASAEVNEELAEQLAATQAELAAIKKAEAARLKAEKKAADDAKVEKEAAAKDGK